jgi:hypothetical protein
MSLLENGLLQSIILLHAALEDSWVPNQTPKLLVRSVLLGPKGLPKQVP